jgi:DNA-binding MarR family transcriptional regulator
MGRDKDKLLEGSRYDTAEESPGYLFWKAFNRWNQSLRHELDRFGLTQAQYSILAAISYLGSTRELVSQQDVSRQLSMDKMMVSDVVKTLERKKMLVRKPHPTDGRAFSLNISSHARGLMAQVVPAVEKVDEIFFSRLRLEDRKAFCSLLIRLME